MLTIFLSYSHRDEEWRKELETHLAILRRQGVIDVWHDRRIGAGKEIDAGISEPLNTAELILLLVSPYFLASDYCYDIEMTLALERHERGEARVIPIILQPCEWQEAPFGKLRATPTDGKPIAKFPNQHDAFLEVARDIRNVAQELQPQSQPRQSRVVIATPRTLARTRIRSSNLRIKKQFTDREKDRFLDETFEYLANFFEGSLSELEERNPDVETRFKRIDANRFEAAIYVNGSVISHCTIRQGGRNSFGGGITYSTGSGEGNSFNEALSVADDGYMLFLKPFGLALRFSPQEQSEQQLTQQGAAEAFWSLLIERLQH